MLRFVQMRYSYFGTSAWRSKASRDKAILFDPDRLAERFRMFRQIALASLRDQEEKDFVLGILTSDDLPKEHLKLLREAACDVLGDRARVYPRPPAKAGEVFREIQQELVAGHGHDHVAQIVLDDDDALSADFMTELRRDAELAIPRVPPHRPYCFLSFSRGVSLVSEKGGGYGYYTRDVPYTNLGLTLLARPDSPRNVYLVSHSKLAIHHPSRVVNDMRFYYLRSIHGSNDSRGIFKPEKPLKSFQMRLLRARFPLLADLDPLRHEAALAAE
ncbi:glycosyltransferase [Pseudooceanicola marinus]|uniref:glycosyltransferase n=1 Tax=Pseudooceanicola marinus TaxID=396013 RepID=UPI00296E2DF8|nr:glycosyltransferase [Pseudooceanicola marinus]